MRNNKGNAVSDCTKRGCNGATCAKTTAGNGDEESEDEELPQDALQVPKRCSSMVVMRCLWGLVWGTILLGSFFLVEKYNHCAWTQTQIHAGTFVVQKDFKDYKSLQTSDINLTQPVFHWLLDTSDGAITHQVLFFLSFFFYSKKGFPSLSMQCI